MPNATVLNRVFQSFDALHVYSDKDVVVIKQGKNVIKLRDLLVPELLDALRYEIEGEQE